MSKRPTLPTIPATMTAEAVGFVAIRPDRPERLALFRRDGTVSNTFAIDEDHAAVGALLARSGLRLLEDGCVVR